MSAQDEEQRDTCGNEEQPVKARLRITADGIDDDQHAAQEECARDHIRAPETRANTSPSTDDIQREHRDSRTEHHGEASVDENLFEAANQDQHDAASC